MEGRSSPEPFVWKKREKRQRQIGRSDAEEAQRQAVLREDLERAKARRLARVADQREWDEQLAQVQRERWAAQEAGPSSTSSSSVGEKDDGSSGGASFVALQMRRRAEIRVREGRASQVDRLFHAFVSADAGAPLPPGLPLRDPASWPRVLPSSALAAEMKAIHEYSAADPSRLEFWEALYALFEAEEARRAEIAAVQSRDTAPELVPEPAPAQGAPMHADVQRDLRYRLAALPAAELRVVLRDAEGETAAADGDPEFWMAALPMIRHLLRVAVLREAHCALLRLELSAIESGKQTRGGGGGSKRAVVALLMRPAPGRAAPPALGRVLADHEFDGLLFAADDASLPPDADIVDEADDVLTIVEQRRAVRVAQQEKWVLLKARQQNGSGRSRESGAAAEDDDSECEEEEDGNLERVPLRLPSYEWAGRYRPRPPRYINRVLTGYSWNRYNRVHYTTTNPPPRSVIGYRFNIFYPDLVDSSVAPTYHLERTDDPDVQLLRFHAGAPYEDVAFHILNRPWNTARSAGFRCVFENGVLKLHFRLRRSMYRR